VYASRQDIEAIYGARHLETLVPADVDIDVAVSRAITAAAAMIDPYLRKRYRLPLPVIPAIIQQCAIDLACWQLAPAADRMSEEIEKRAKIRIAFLTALADGKVDIAELEAAQISIGGGPNSAETDSGAAFFTDERRWPTGGGLL